MKRILGSRRLNLIGERQTSGCVFKMAVFNLWKHASSHQFVSFSSVSLKIRMEII